MPDTSGKSVILIVDDVVQNIDMLYAILSEKYLVKVANNGRRALKIASGENPPDLILLDVIMPEMDGFEVCGLLKSQEKTRKIPVIFVTAKDETGNEQRGFALGAVDYITKPVSPPIVEARVQTQLALHRALRDLEAQNTLLIENARLREQVERMMHHDLKSPLSVVLWTPSMLKERGDLPPDVIETLETLEKSGHQMLDMINKSLDLFKIENGTYVVRPVAVDILRTCRQISAEFKGDAELKNVSTRLTIDDQEPQEDDQFLIMGEDALTYSMLANLFKNAIEASPEGGVVAITVGTTPHPFLSIHNQGAIPTEIQPRFLQKFATSGKENGTGLGAYSARLMAETMDGKVTFKSSQEEGTTITIAFPKEADAAKPTEDTWTQNPALQFKIARLSVLIVDDNEMMRYTIRQILRQKGVKNIKSARDVKEAKSLIQSGHSIDVVISDWDMPQASGLDFLTWLRKQSGMSQVPFIMITGHADQLKVKQAGGAGTSAFLLKPFSPDTLCKKIESLLP